MKNHQALAILLRQTKQDHRVINAVPLLKETDLVTNVQTVVKPQDVPEEELDREDLIRRKKLRKYRKPRIKNDDTEI